MARGSICSHCVCRSLTFCPVFYCTPHHFCGFCLSFGPYKCKNQCITLIHPCVRSQVGNSMFIMSVFIAMCICSAVVVSRSNCKWNAIRCHCVHDLDKCVKVICYSYVKFQGHLTVICTCSYFLTLEVVTNVLWDLTLAKYPRSDEWIALQAC